MVRAVYPQYQWIESRFHERLEKDRGPEELPSQPEQQREVSIILKYLYIYYSISIYLNPFPLSLSPYRYWSALQNTSRCGPLMIGIL